MLCCYDYACQTNSHKHTTPEVFDVANINYMLSMLSNIELILWHLLFSSILFTWLAFKHAQTMSFIYDKIILESSLIGTLLQLLQSLAQSCKELYSGEYCLEKKKKRRRRKKQKSYEEKISTRKCERIVVNIN